VTQPCKSPKELACLQCSCHISSRERQAVDDCLFTWSFSLCAYSRPAEHDVVPQTNVDTSRPFRPDGSFAGVSIPGSFETPPFFVFFFFPGTSHGRSFLLRKGDRSFSSEPSPPPTAGMRSSSGAVFFVFVVLDHLPFEEFQRKVIGRFRVGDFAHRGG